MIFHSFGLLNERNCTVYKRSSTNNECGALVKQYDYDFPSHFDTSFEDNLDAVNPKMFLVPRGSNQRALLYFLIQMRKRAALLFLDRHRTVGINCEEPLI